MPLSAPEYWLEWTKNYFRCQFTHVGELIHKETWSAASFGWAEGLQTINPPIYRLTTAVSDIDQTNINRDIRDGNWLSNSGWRSQSRLLIKSYYKTILPYFWVWHVWYSVIDRCTSPSSMATIWRNIYSLIFLFYKWFFCKFKRRRSVSNSKTEHDFFR